MQNHIIHKVNEITASGAVIFGDRNKSNTELCILNKKSAANVYCKLLNRH